MKAAVIVKNGKAHEAFEIREVEKPKLKPGHVLIKVEGFGINFADVMARTGLYRDAPPLPSIVGYDAVGHIEEIADDVSGLQVGQRVVAFTRFGAYAEYAIADARGVTPIGDNVPVGEATALGTQYCTAYYMACDITNMYEGEHVLVHAAAGGVGTALVQIAKHQGCIVYGTAGSDAKLDYLREQGVDYPINYRQKDYEEEVNRIRKGERLDVIFDPIGGHYVKKDMKILGAGGRLVLFGASSLSNKGFFGKWKEIFGFGFWHPGKLMQSSKSMICVNMLRIGDYKSVALKRVLEAVVQGYEQGIYKPTVGKVFKAEEIADAHEYVEQRKSMGKVSVIW